MLTGQQAIEHLDQVRQDRGKADAFRSAASSLVARGFRPTNHVIVLRTIRLVGAAVGNGNDPSIVPVQTYSDSEGEITFWSFDDGYNGTWEGTVFGTRYDNGAWLTLNTQVLIETEDYRALWTERIGGGGPRQATYPQAPEFGGFLRRVATYKHLHSESPGGRILRVQTSQDFNQWLGCTAIRCGGARAGCILAGPKWPECFGFICGSAMIFCYVQAYLI